MGRSSKAHGGVPVGHTKQLPRLRRIEGQVRGIHQMIESERNCVEIAHQINAVVAALRRVEGDMLREHLAALAEAAVSGGLSAAERRRHADEFGSLVAKLNR